jgi:hypothetical protein
MFIQNGEPIFNFFKEKIQVGFLKFEEGFGITDSPLELSFKERIDSA